MDDLTGELLTLLDLIENESDEQHIQDIAHQRFEICKKHGLIVAFGEQISGEIN